MTIDEARAFLIHATDAKWLPADVKKALRLLLADHAQLCEDRNALAEVAVPDYPVEVECNGTPCWCKPSRRRTHPGEHAEDCTVSRAAYARYEKDQRR